MKGEIIAAVFSRQLIPSSGNPAEIPTACPPFSSHPTHRLVLIRLQAPGEAQGTRRVCPPHRELGGTRQVPFHGGSHWKRERGCLLPGELVVGLTLKLLLLPWAAPRALPLCSLSAAGRGVGLCLYMVFSAAAECCCAIPGLCVVCGTLSTRVGLRGGRVRPG